MTESAYKAVILGKLTLEGQIFRKITSDMGHPEHK